MELKSCYQVSDQLNALSDELERASGIYVNRLDELVLQIWTVEVIDLVDRRLIERYGLTYPWLAQFMSIWRAPDR